MTNRENGALEKIGLDRRRMIGGLLAGGAVLTLPACATTQRWSLVDAIRQLLFLSSMNAFARLTAPGGYWDANVAQLGLEGFLGNRGNVLTSILTSALFKTRLERAFAGFARDASDRAAPLVTDAVRVIGFENAVALVRGGPTAATGFLRQQMGNALIEAMVPEVGRAMRIAQEPLVGQMLSALTGVDVPGVATTFSTRVNDVIWQEIGVEEAAIRANPRATNDPLLIGVFGAASYL
ncbi:DUF4197 domain-containing protein [Alteraurantiacibacter palmitatis]|uniref:DUF4197 domain-containing protein n=1 Tax=Alteraurantiacibacter palmitatis TaxID=2054628 RepID=A0ABV7E8A6_9SPHN